MLTEQEAWFGGRLPDGWFETVSVESDRDEIFVVGSISPPDLPPDTGADERRAAYRGRIQRFREETRPERMQIADEAESRFERKVSWGATCGEETVLFTHLAVPAMTRLRMSDRRVLDTLVAGGVARSRAEALAWCVRLVGKHQEEWIEELRKALVAVEEVRRKAPED